MHFQELLWECGESQSFLHNFWWVRPVCHHDDDVLWAIYDPFMYIGITNIYLLVQIIFWNNFHTLGLGWGILFPFHYRRFKTEGKIKYIHIVTVILGLVLPAISALAPLIDGYTVTPSPIDNCVGRNMAITFFMAVLPISILLAVNSTVLVILFWTIFKVYQVSSWPMQNGRIVILK